jgi:hypothetical protein
MSQCNFLHHNFLTDCRGMKMILYGEGLTTDCLGQGSVCTRLLTNYTDVLITYVGQYQKKVTLLTVGWTIDTDFDIFTVAFCLWHSLRSRGR